MKFTDVRLFLTVKIIMSGVGNDNTKMMRWAKKPGFSTERLSTDESRAILVG